MGPITKAVIRAITCDDGDRYWRCSDLSDRDFVSYAIGCDTQDYLQMCDIEKATHSQSHPRGAQMVRQWMRLMRDGTDLQLLL